VYRERRKNRFNKEIPGPRGPWNQAPCGGPIPYEDPRVDHKEPRGGHEFKPLNWFILRN